MPDKEFPTTEAGVNLLLQNLLIKLPAWQFAVGVTNAEMSVLAADAANYNYLLTTTQAVLDSKDSYFEFKDAMMIGPIGTDALPSPTFPTITTPEPAIPGIVKRLRRLIQQIKVSSGYTQQIGEDLGLVESSPNNFNPNDLNAELKVRALANGKVEISFSKQGMDAMRVEFRRKGETAWTLAGIYTSSPGIHDAPSVPAEEPEQREYRGILSRKNEDVGNMSPIYTIVTTP